MHRATTLLQMLGLKMFDIELIDGQETLKLTHPGIDGGQK
jgi:hypothetical protein